MSKRRIPKRTYKTGVSESIGRRCCSRTHGDIIGEVLIRSGRYSDTRELQLVRVYIDE